LSERSHEARLERIELALAALALEDSEIRLILAELLRCRPPIERQTSGVDVTEVAGSEYYRQRAAAIDDRAQRD
jgi:hypothetical protein